MYRYLWFQARTRLTCIRWPPWWPPPGTERVATLVAKPLRALLVNDHRRYMGQPSWYIVDTTRRRGLSRSNVLRWDDPTDLSWPRWRRGTASELRVVLQMQRQRQQEKRLDNYWELKNKPPLRTWGVRGDSF